MRPRGDRTDATLVELHHYQDIFFAPARLHPNLHSEQVTRAVADVFAAVAVHLERAKKTAPPDKIARFLMQLVFSMFAEDVRLLPPGAHEQKGVLTEILSNYTKPMHIEGALLSLFRAMQSGGFFGAAKIEYFNGSLYEDVQVFGMDSELFKRLSESSRFDWSQVEPSIFGTLFERVLDKAQRRRLGAHYTSAADIALIVEPVLIAPLRAAWESARAEAAPLRAAYDSALDDRARHAAADKLKRIRARILKHVRTVRVLDPACGSGNFLYVALRLLLDLEQAIVQSELWEGLPREGIAVHPRQLFGMEINPNAHALASIVVWIGYLQWKYEHRYPLNLDPPILQDLTRRNIRRMDAILTHTADGAPAEPDWPAVDVIIGNPPFLGGKRQRAALGDEYVKQLRLLYSGRLAGDADLVTYWFERARDQIKKGKAKRSGLIATNSIRDGANRTVLERIKESGDIFMAHSDREWTLNGAAVRVSIICFDDGSEKTRTLDGKIVSVINADLTAHAAVTEAKQLPENANLCFLGMMKAGAFDIEEHVARDMLEAINSSGRSNADVVKPRLAGQDVTDRSRPIWIIDFGVDTPIEIARLYEKPFEYLEVNVKPHRARSSEARQRDNWWLLGRSRPNLREALKGKERCIVTAEVSKYRHFIWMDTNTIPDHTLHVVARDDDYFFGVLHSRIHEVWSLTLGSYIGAGNDPRYTSSVTFETFPFPFPPGSEPTADPRVVAIAQAARDLHAARHAWLHADALDARDRTLTHLYNALAAHRGTATRDSALKESAVAFAPALARLHDALDRAVCAAYGWDESLLADESALLGSLLGLNAARSG